MFIVTLIIEFVDGMTRLLASLRGLSWFDAMSIIPASFFLFLDCLFEGYLFFIYYFIGLLINAIKFINSIKILFESDIRRYAMIKKLSSSVKASYKQRSVS